MTSSTASQIRRRVLRSRDRFWRTEDFAGSPPAVNTELSRLADAGELERVRRGVYWRGRKTRFGTTVPPPVAALRELVSSEEAVGAAGWYATNLLGLSTQVAPQPVVAVTTRSPTGLPGVKVIDRSARVGRREAHLNQTEVTLLEALDGWDKYVELDHAAALARFVEILRGADIRLPRLVQAARTEAPRVRERLREALRHGGCTSEAERVPPARGRARPSATQPP
jgi:hypothetical protein